MGKQLSPWIQAPASVAIRALFNTATVAAPGPTIRTMGQFGRMYATAGPNRKRLKRTADHLGVAFPDWDADRREHYAVKSFEHLFKFATELAYIPRMLTEDGWFRYVNIGDLAPGVRELIRARPCVLISGHCGNFEVVGYTVALLGFPMHALYRPLDLKPLDAWVRRTRSARGLTLVDKFGAAGRLPGLVRGGAPIGFVADQNAGDRGLFVPYFGRLASTYKSIGLLAMRFNATVLCGMARRRWPEEDEGGAFRFRIELADVFGPQDWQDQPDPLFYLTARYRRALEQMVRRAPDQYFWMHRMWRSRPHFERAGRPVPDSLKDKLRSLPWMDDQTFERILDHSRRDTQTLAETGLTRLP